MKVHIIYDPNRRDSVGVEVRVHKAGCPDIKRDINPNRFSLHGASSHYETEALSKTQIAEEFWGDFIDTDSMTLQDAMNYTEFLPCTRGLPAVASAPAAPTAPATRCLSDGKALFVLYENVPGIEEEDDDERFVGRYCAVCLPVAITRRKFISAEVRPLNDAAGFSCDGVPGA